MKTEKRNRLEKAGWKAGSASEFLGLSPAEEAFIELKLALARSLRHHRTARALTQAGAARMLGLKPEPRRQDGGCGCHRLPGPDGPSTLTLGATLLPLPAPSPIRPP